MKKYDLALESLILTKEFSESLKDYISKMKMYKILAILYMDKESYEESLECIVWYLHWAWYNNKNEHELKAYYLLS